MACYTSATRRYYTFCRTYQLSTFPLSEQTLCRFVTFLTLSGLSSQSIRSYLSALRYAQIRRGGSDPAYSALSQLHYVLRGIQRSLPPSVRPRRLPITPSILGLLHGTWSSQQSTDRACLWAACCLAFFAFLRSGEFTCQSWAAYQPHMLSVSDIQVDSRSNPTMLRVTLRRSKTDVFGLGVNIHVGKTGSIVCPVSAVLAYIAIRPSTPGPLFLLESGAPLSRQVLVNRVREAWSTAGFNVSLFNGHSFRIGAATTAAQAGLSDSNIQLLGRWRSSAFIRYLPSPTGSGISRHIQTTGGLDMHSCYCVGPRTWLIDWP